MKFSRIALVGAATLAVAQPHNHAHKHPARHGSPVEARDAAVTETVPGPVVTVYELNGEDITWSDVQAGLKDGKYVLVGDKISTVAPAAPSTTATPTPTPTPAPSSTEAAKFFEKPSSSSEPSSTYVAPPPVESSAAPVKSSSYSSGGDVNSEFPSGKVACSDFPSNYGAINLDWLNLGGWSGIQRVPGFKFGVDSAIGLIETAISGESCTKGAFCSYACPAGYQKSQWPEAQGSTQESIGGLFCNSNGMLELSKPDVKQLCTQGVGGVKVVSKLGQTVSVCRTDYPGTESETIPLVTEAGGENELTCPDIKNYYTWGGAGTSAQYYVNNAGVPVSEACQWGTAGSNKGNWAPVNIGVGKGADGNLYISVFPNEPTINPKLVKLNFNIDIKVQQDNGEYKSSGCGYKDGEYIKDFKPSSSGCTAGVPNGKNAYYEFS